ncbi:MAG TPA: CDP-alcohol phosphatidyltransferase family protein [Gemmatimonadaceae bacterium]|nr:CDP-alcohol phosphatidyltransferase family protein [Gemmatimonadaceae bacterium]
MNLPNAITIGRIAASPLVGWLPLTPSASYRAVAFVLFVVLAVSDYWDGRLARSRNSITDLGKQLDPLADKLFLVVTMVPMYLLMRPKGPDAGIVQVADSLKFITPWGAVGLPLWVAIVIIGRELAMTIFRQMAANRGVVISAIGPAKWKTGFQMTWVGAAFFWFWAATAGAAYGWQGTLWDIARNLNGIIGVVCMIGAVGLTLYSLLLYVRRYGGVFLTRAGAGTGR